MTVSQAGHSGGAVAALRVAGIDCGTNSIRLVIADVVDGQLYDVAREMRVVRLGAGVDETGEFSQEALERTFSAVDEYAQILQEHGVKLSDHLRFVATSATRDATNRNVFISGVQQRLGVEPEVISGIEEAELSFSGALASGWGHFLASSGATSDEGSLSSAQRGPRELPVSKNVLVVDLGGGSTEFVLGSLSLGTGADGESGLPDIAVKSSLSVNMGCVRFTERYLHSDPPTPQEQAAARREVKAFLDEVSATVDFSSVDVLVGVAGTVTTITAHALGLDSYDPEELDATQLSVTSYSEASRSLIEATRAERAALPFMHPGRVDVIGAGALIWSTIVEAVHRATGETVATAWASEHDILDGIALSVAASR